MLKMYDKVGGRRRFGFLRGCLSDIIHHNRTAIRSISTSTSRTSRTETQLCKTLRLQDLFINSDSNAFDRDDHVDFCTCFNTECNSGPKSRNTFAIMIFSLIAAIFCGSTNSLFLKLPICIPSKHFEATRLKRSESVKITKLKYPNITRNTTNAKWNGRKRWMKLLVKRRRKGCLSLPSVYEQNCFH